MICLAVNTVQAAVDLALSRDGEIVSACREEMARGQDAALPALVTALLTEAETALGDIDRLAVITGPGSFTGTRIGVAFVRGLALSLGVPAIGVTSLEAALPVSAPLGWSVCLLPAQKRPPDLTWWGQVFRDGEAASWPFEMDHRRMSSVFAGLNAQVFGDVTDLGDVFAGPATAAHPEAWRAALRAETRSPRRAKPAPVYVRAPDAALPKARSAG